MVNNLGQFNNHLVFTLFTLLFLKILLIITTFSYIYDFFFFYLLSRHFFKIEEKVLKIN